MSAHPARASDIADSRRGPRARLRWSPARVLEACALGAWAVLFWWLMVTGRTSLYLSARTDWLVPVGAITLTVATLGRIGSARARETEPVAARDAVAVAAIILPVVAVMALPPTALGSYAVARRSSLVGASSAGSSAAEIASGDLSLFDVAGGLQSRAAMRTLVARAGSEVSFTGFVTRAAGMPADEFSLTRFLITCCVADALSIQVRIVGAPPGAFDPDDWVRVTGRIYPLGREVVVDADKVVGVARPRHPYLNP
jgi:putative membrane protein